MAHCRFVECDACHKKAEIPNDEGPWLPEGWLNLLVTRSARGTDDRMPTPCVEREVCSRACASAALATALEAFGT